jgi:hypothetical protein
MANFFSNIGLAGLTFLGAECSTNLPDVDESARNALSGRPPYTLNIEDAYITDYSEVGGLNAADCRFSVRGEANGEPEEDYSIYGVDTCAELGRRNKAGNTVDLGLKIPDIDGDGLADPDFATQITIDGVTY